MRDGLLWAAPIWLTFLTTLLILLVAGANPWRAYGNLITGAFGGVRKLADITVAMVPLLLCSAGMLVTFAAGLWNIGVEGQMVAGALMTTWLVQAVTLPRAVMVPLTVVAGVLGGALWGFLTGVLRTYAGVNEIFGGLGLNYVAAGLTNYLIFGPWKPPDGATMSGTDPFPNETWMPSIGVTRASWPAILLALIALGVVFYLLRDSYWGLRLKAIGLNSKAATRLGLRTKRDMLSAFIVCGALAGIAGSLQTTAVYHRLIPQISGGYGYLAQLVVLLSGLSAPVVPLIVLFFAAVQVGSPRLELRMQLDSSIGGILQASTVLFFFLVRGIREKLGLQGRSSSLREPGAGERYLVED